MKFSLKEGDANVKLFHVKESEFRHHYPNLPLAKVKKGSPERMVSVCQFTLNNVTVTEYAEQNLADQFQRRVGGSIALSRAFDYLFEKMKVQLSKESRTKIWQRMFAKGTSPYRELNELVDKKPQLAKRLVEAIRNKEISV